MNMKKKSIIIVIILVLVAGIAFYLFNISRQQPLVTAVENQSIKVTAEGVKYIVDPDKSFQEDRPRTESLLLTNQNSYRLKKRINGYRIMNWFWQ